MSRKGLGKRSASLDEQGFQLLANQEQLEILNHGVKVWNEWRAGRLAKPDLTGAVLEGRDLADANLAGADLSGADLRKANLQSSDLADANLQGAHLQNANLQRAKLQSAQLIRAEMSGADLRDANLQSAALPAANLQGANLQNADLQGTHLRSANLQGADLRNANLQGTNLQAANLKGAKLREADLRGADLSNVQGGLRPDQLAGTDLTGAKLPGPIDKLFEDLDAVKDISESARKLFVAMLAACLYSWLTIATTTDVNLITDRASSPLPIIQTSIPIVGFYVVAPLLLLCVYFYFHFYLQKLWEELGSLPAIFPDGRPLHARSDPWLLNDLVRSHLPKLRADRPFMSYFQQAISMVLAWWLVPITLVMFWGRYLPRHDYSWLGTKLHVALLAISITAAVFLYRLAAGTLRGAQRRSFSWTHAVKSPRAYGALAIFVATGAAFVVVSLGAIWGVPSGHRWRKAYGRYSWVPRAMALLRYSPFANLGQTDVSIKPPNWTGKNESELDLVKGAELSGADLRYADADQAFLAKAVLVETHLEGAYLLESDLRGANLSSAHLDFARLPEAHLNGADLTAAELRGADLWWVDLREANLRGADLNSAKLDAADLKFADFRALFGAIVTRITPDALKSALNWDKAYYDSDLLRELGLPPDHNEKLEEEQKQEEQQKGQSAAGSTGAPAGQKPQLRLGKPASPKQGNK
jgi:uncharacterized protein YjbI with pentapeptide repeats